MGFMQKANPEMEEGDPMTPDNTPAHEGAESASLETQEGAEEDGGEQPNVSPEEQQDYDAMAAMALDMVYSQDYLPNVLKAMSATKDGLAESIGMLGANIMKSAVSAFQQKGKNPDPETVLQVASNELVPALVELAIKSGKAKEADAPGLIRDALFSGAEQYGQRELSSGEISPQARQEAQAGVQLGEGQSQGAPQPDAGFRPNRAQRRALKRQGLMERA